MHCLDHSHLMQEEVAALQAKVDGTDRENSAMVEGMISTEQQRIKLASSFASAQEQLIGALVRVVGAVGAVGVAVWTAQKRVKLASSFASAQEQLIKTLVVGRSRRLRRLVGRLALNHKRELNPSNYRSKMVSPRRALKSHLFNHPAAFV